MIKPISNNKELFCHRYWKNVIKNTRPSNEYKGRVSTAIDIYDVNTFFMNGNHEAKKMIENYLKTPLYKFLAKTDLEFKQLTPVKEDLVLWRGISPPSKNYKKRNLKYAHAMSYKAGDIVFMPEYAYASKSMKLSMSYADSGVTRNGILYEIHVPKGSKIHNSTEYIFQRASKFECLEAEDKEIDEKTYRHIVLNYIEPEEIKLNMFENMMRYLK